MEIGGDLSAGCADPSAGSPPQSRLGPESAPYQSSCYYKSAGRALKPAAQAGLTFHVETRD